MTYTIKPGNIAAVCSVIDPDGKETHFIYLAEGEIPVAGTKDSHDPFLALPKSVQTAVNKHFSDVFSLPVDQRGEFLRNLSPSRVAT